MTELSIAERARETWCPDPGVMVGLHEPGEPSGGLHTVRAGHHLDHPAHHLHQFVRGLRHRRRGAGIGQIALADPVTDSDQELRPGAEVVGGRALGYTSLCRRLGRGSVPAALRSPIARLRPPGRGAWLVSRRTTINLVIGHYERVRSSNGWRDCLCHRSISGILRLPSAENMAPPRRLRHLHFRRLQIFGHAAVGILRGPCGRSSRSRPDPRWGWTAVVLLLTASLLGATMFMPWWSRGRKGLYRDHDPGRAFTPQRTTSGCARCSRTAVSLTRPGF